MSFDFRASLDPGSLEEIVRLQGFSSLLTPEIQQGLIQVGQLLAGAASQNALNVFTRNDPGGLADSIYPWLVSPTELEVRVGVPWGQRREKGFSGMTDGLGRYYPYDPGKPYLEPAMEQHQQDVEALMAAAVNSALGRVAA